MPFQNKWIYGLLFCWYAPLMNGQVLWPGDVNNNGIVNGVDVLYVGLAFNTTGPERSNDDDEWAPVTIDQLWSQSFPDGINFAFADCNGDGVIDESDISTIEENYGLTHGTLLDDGYTNGLPGMDPSLSLTPSSDKAEPGDLINIGLTLGSAEQPVHDFYGLTFQFSFSPDLVDKEDDDDNESAIEYEEGETNLWIERFQDNELEYLLVADGNTGQGDFTITRTDQQPVDMGQGPIGLFTIVIEDIVVGLEQPELLEFRIDRVRLIDTSLNTTAIAPDTTTILIARDTSEITTSESLVLSDQHQVDVFPNPSRGSVYMKTNAIVDDLEIVDLLGRKLPVHWEPGAIHGITLRDSDPGIYYLIIKMEGQIETRKIIFIPQ